MNERRLNVYLASGWFTPMQKEVMDKVRNVLLEFSSFNVFAPFYEGVVLDKSNDSQKKRAEVFKVNTDAIIECDLMVAVIDDFDPGTIFEMGVAWGIGDCMWPAIVAYSDVPGRGLNVMLAQACVGFANGADMLREKLKRLEKLIDAPEEWSGEAT